MKIFCHYDIKENEDEKRTYFYASASKIKYICECLEQLNAPCEIISISGTKLNKSVPKKKIQISDNIILSLPKSFGQKNRILKVLDRWQIKFMAFIKLMKIKKDEPLFVYHSLTYMTMIKLVKRIKRMPLILEVEEIYGDVTGDKKTSEKELNFFNIADSFIFSTESLNEKINTQNKPHTVIYGTYKVENDRNCGFNDDKIHVVYAGTFDSNKGGAQAALSSAPYLDSNYHLHIIGFGNKTDTKNVLNEIERLSRECNSTVTYDGLLSGEDYIRFLQSCHIGLSTQNQNAGFNDTSFPSKVLSYLSNGLRVVTIRIKVLEQSKISSLMHYYDVSDGESIAQAIKEVDVNSNFDGRMVVASLNNEFIKDLKCMLGE